MKTIIVLIFILVMSLTNVLAYDSSYIVKQDGTGDYIEIQDAIDAVSNGTSAIIYVYGSLTPYSGSDNTNLSWNGNDKTIYMYGINNPQIDCNNNSRAFNLLYTTEEDIIKGFVIYDAYDNGSLSGGAIRVKDGCIKILNNTFDNCSDESYSAGYVMSGNYWSSSKGGAIFIEHYNDNQSSEISGNSFAECVAFYGGAICIEEGYCLIENNEFDDNHACYNEIGTGNNGKGGAIYLTSSSVDVKNNEFTSNSSPELGIIVDGASEVSDNVFDGNYRGDWDALSDNTYLVTCSTFKNNIVKNHSIYNSNNYYLTNATTNRNNTFISNAVSLSLPSSDLPYSNCIFKNNTYAYGFFGDEDLDYCLIYNSGSTTGTTMTNCITGSDPQIHSTTYQPLWTSSVKSLCIDSGDPTITDDDDTPSDIGAICATTHKFDVLELPDTSEDNGIKWLSFPALDVVLDDADLASYVLDDILDPNILDEVEAEDYTIYYDQGSWQNDDEQFSRTEGFIFTMNDDYDLGVPGFKVADNTTIALTGNDHENYVGYWLEETQAIDDAFGDDWDNGNVHLVKHQKWTATRDNGVWRYRVQQGIPTPPTISYADMVIVECNTNISSFSWDNDTPEESRVVYPEPSYYSFTEQTSYVPIFVEVNENNPPGEIGAYVNDVCIGATVVEGDLAQINAYTNSTQPGEIELELYYGSRSNMQPQRYARYHCRGSNETNMIYTQMHSDDPVDVWFVSFKDESSTVPTPIKLTVDNYPNPFNPITSISYSIPYESDVTLNIYNVKGQLVKSLVSGNQPEGYYNVEWSGKDDSGKAVTSGIYYYQIKACGNTLHKKMLLLK